MMCCGSPSNLNGERRASGPDKKGFHGAAEAEIKLSQLHVETPVSGCDFSGLFFSHWLSAWL